MRLELSRLGSGHGAIFTPHLVPVNRGILTTAHILLNEPMEQEEVERRYKDYYRDEFFVRYQNPALAVSGAVNFCD